MAAQQDDTQELASFAVRLIHDLAVPVLDHGYRELVSNFRQNSRLNELAESRGIATVLASDDPEIVELQKGNKEFVTQAEKIAEQKMTDAIVTQFPHHSIIGEELGSRSAGELCWVFDPVDGTSAMLRTALAEAFGVSLSAPLPAFGVMVGLLAGKKAIVGVVVELLPANPGLRSGSTWVGHDGGTTTRDGEPCELGTIPADIAATEMVCTAPIAMMAGKDAATKARLRGLISATANCVTDQNCIGYMRLLEKDSAIRIAGEVDLGLPDIAALYPILAGAGITVTDLTGQQHDFSPHNRNNEWRILAAPSALHGSALAVMDQAAANPADNKDADQTDESHEAGYVTKFQ